MLFVTPDNPGQCPPPAKTGKRRWTSVAAQLAGLAALVIFILAMLFIFRPDPSRRMLDEIDLLMAGGDWQQAETLCRRRIAEHSATGRPGTAASTRTSDPSADLALRRGISLSMLERFDEARSVFDEAITRHPADSRLILNLALVDYRTGQLDDALAHLQQLAHDAPYAPNVNYHVGRIYEAKGLYDSALQAYRDELNISSSAGAWQRYLVLKKMRGATTTRPAEGTPGPVSPMPAR